ncbi:MAG TPA: glycosyltransferase family 2 protein [Candidatus Binataceae bacterium]|nr:glycosyltransferase family 2 protein [Candidatus Binataceae bacterium]
MPQVSISVVSHRQASLVAPLLENLRALRTPIEVLLTVNVPEEHGFRDEAAFPPLRVIENATRKGFAANHNAAFRLSQAEYFCVLNPDIRLAADPFPTLIEQLRLQGLGVIGPRVLTPQGSVEESARDFPTPLTILAKALDAGMPASLPATGMAYPAWIAGMFMLFPRAVYEQAGGFDERYFLYYEDVDLCARLKKLGYRVGYCADVSVIHDARRTSHRDPRYMRWHLASMARFFWRRAMGRI